MDLKTIIDAWLADIIAKPHRQKPHLKSWAQKWGFLWGSIVISVGIVFAFLFSGYAFDDPFITYRVVNNLIGGEGWVYNAGERVNAVTSPLHTILLALLSLIPSADPPAAGVFVTLLGLAVTAWLLPPLLEQTDYRPGHIIAAAAVMLNPHLLQTMGMETGLLLPLCVGMVLTYMMHRWELFGLLSALAILTRMDASLLLGVILVHRFMRHREFPPRNFFIVLGIILAPWFLFSAAYFRELLPHTLAVKLAQAQSGEHWGGQWIFISSFFQYVFRFIGRLDMNGALCLILLLFGLERTVRVKNPAPALFSLWAAAHVIVYGIILRAPYYSWYLAPVTLVLSIWAGLGAGRLPLFLLGRKDPDRIFFGALALAATLWFFGFILGAGKLAALSNPLHLGHVLAYLALGAGAVIYYFPSIRKEFPARAAFAGIIALAALFPQHLVYYQQMTHVPTSQFLFYQAAAEWIGKNRPEAKTVGAHEIGVLGYHLPAYKIIDQCGIPDAENAKALARGDMTWWIKAHRPELLVLHPSRDWWSGVEGQILDAPWFAMAYRPAVAILAGPKPDAVTAVDPRSLSPENLLKAQKHEVMIWELKNSDEVPSLYELNAKPSF